MTDQKVLNRVLRLNAKLADERALVGQADAELLAATDVLNPDTARAWLALLHFSRIENAKRMRKNRWLFYVRSTGSRTQEIQAEQERLEIDREQIERDLATAENLLRASLNPKDELARIATLVAWATGELGPAGIGAIPPENSPEDL